jgi:hypothetical protein
VIRKNGPWRNLEFEVATLTWVDWFDFRRLLSSIGDVPPAEFEAMYYEAQESPATEVRLKRRTRGGSDVRLLRTQDGVRPWPVRAAGMPGRRSSILSEPMRAFAAAQCEVFERDGFVRLEAAFPRSVAERCRERLWQVIGLDPSRPSTWRRPVIHAIGGAEAPFTEACDTPPLRAAWDALVGAGRWKPRTALGTVVVRFPSEGDPGDAGWHVDGSFEIRGRLHVNLHSRSRALLMLFLLSDVGERDAPTRIRVGSHLLVPPVLREAGPTGLPSDQVAQRVEGLEGLPVALATGAAGDVFLCHPFLIHAASWPHRGGEPRFMAQPGLTPAFPLQLDRRAADRSPVERAIHAGLGRADPAPSLVPAAR